MTVSHRSCLDPSRLPLSCLPARRARRPSGFKLQTKNIAFGRSHAEFSIEAADANIDHVFFAGDDLKSCVFYHDRSQLELTLSTEAARRIQHSANLDAGEFSREQIAIKIDRNEAMHIGTAGKQPMFLHEILNLCNRSAREVSASPIARVGGGGAFTSTMECGKPRALASAFRETPDSVIETTQTEQPLKPKLTFAQAAEPQQGVAAGAAPRASAPKTAAAAAAAAKPARAPLVGAKAALQTGATAGADSFQHFDEKLKPAFDQQPTRTAPQRGTQPARTRFAPSQCIASHARSRATPRRAKPAILICILLLLTSPRLPFRPLVAVWVLCRALFLTFRIDQTHHARQHGSPRQGGQAAGCRARSAYGFRGWRPRAVAAAHGRG
jgi:hypothetical protein